MRSPSRPEPMEYGCAAASPHGDVVLTVRADLVGGLRSHPAIKISAPNVSGSATQPNAEQFAPVDKLIEECPADTDVIGRRFDAKDDGQAARCAVCCHACPFRHCSLSKNCTGSRCAKRQLFVAASSLYIRNRSLELRAPVRTRSQGFQPLRASPLVPRGRCEAVRGLSGCPKSTYAGRVSMWITLWRCCGEPEEIRGCCGDLS